ncbi:hypothetical protein OC861_000397 [Tilletia horrida]|nr:hypothetical protein OC861_000397 [Tilletia horrida]
MSAQKSSKADSGHGHGNHPSSLAEALVHSINPFAAIGHGGSKDGIALTEDGVPTKSGTTPSTSVPGKEHADDGDSDSSSTTTRRRARGTLRSLSPFRFHSHRRSSSRTRLRIGGSVDNGEDDAQAEKGSGKRDWEWGGYWRRRTRRNSDDTVTSANSSKRTGAPADDHAHDEEEVETEREGHMGSWTRICPRNNAFSSSAADEDSEDTEDEGESVAPRPPKPPAKDDDDNNNKGSKYADDLNDDAAEDEKKAEDSEEEEDSEIDEELLDNTLYNAGCLDLHNDWKEAHEYGEHRNWEGYDEDGIARPELLKDQEFCGSPESCVPYADPNHIGDVPIPDDADHLLNAPNLVLSPSQLRRDPCGPSALITPSPPAVAGKGDAGSMLNAGSSAPQNAFDAALSASNAISSGGAGDSSTSGNPADSSTSLASGASEGRRHLIREGTLSSFMGGQLGEGDRALRASRPVFERNRCTITLLHGQYEDKLAASKRPKRYVVASDGSAEALYAIEWTIGTVMRDGDETMIVSVMETDTKLDAVDHVFEDKQTRMSHQKIRQDMALVLARQATNLLQRTRLGVKVVCQALHATNSRRMLIDLTDYFSPTLLIVGSRGIGSLKGILLGSTSHYLLQKASVPVMVARRRLRLPALPRGKADVIQSVRRRHLRLDEASIDKETPPTPEEEGEKKEGEEASKAGAVPDSSAPSEEAASGSASDGAAKDDSAASRSSLETATESMTISSKGDSDSITSEEDVPADDQRPSRELDVKDEDGGERGRSRSRSIEPDS